jgi:hypothetical protein
MRVHLDLLLESCKRLASRSDSQGNTSSSQVRKRGSWQRAMSKRGCDGGSAPKSYDWVNSYKYHRDKLISQQERLSIPVNLAFQ